MSIRATLLILALALAPAAARAQDTMCTNSTPPRPMNDSKSVKPASNAMWLPGFYRWEYGTWRWNHGNWAIPPQGATGWAPAHWGQTNQGHCFVPGHWT